MSIERTSRGTSVKPSLRKSAAARTSSAPKTSATASTSRCDMRIQRVWV